MLYRDFSFMNLGLEVEGLAAIRLSGCPKMDEDLVFLRKFNFIKISLFIETDRL